MFNLLFLMKNTLWTTLRVCNRLLPEKTRAEGEEQRVVDGQHEVVFGVVPPERRFRELAPATPQCLYNVHAVIIFFMS